MLASRRGRRLDLLALVPALLALGLGLWSINFGLPFLFRPDEDVMVGRAVHMVAERSLDPLFANYPPLVFYVFALAEGLVALLGGHNLGGAVHADPSAAYLTARVVSALAFAVTTGLVFLAARRAYGVLGAGIAGLAMAVAPLAVRQAHFATTDMVQAMFVAAAMWAALRARDRRGFAMAGLMCGLAAASKYTGGVVLVFVVAMAWREEGRGRMVRAAVVAAALGFAIPSAVVVLHPVAYAGGLLFLGSRASGNFSTLPLGWIFHPAVTLPFGLGLGAYALALVGIAVAAIHRSRVDVALLAFTLTYWLVTGVGHENFFRYMLPLLPALCLLAAGVICRAPSGRRGYAFGVAILLLIPGTYASVQTDILLGTVDTRRVAADWLDTHYPGGAVLDSPYYGGPFYDSREVQKNLSYSGNQLAAGFEQGRFTARFAIGRSAPPGGSADTPRLTLHSSGPPTQAPSCAEPAGDLFIFHATSFCGASRSLVVYDPLDSFYLPIWGFDQVTHPGPSIRIYGG